MSKNNFSKVSKKKRKKVLIRAKGYRGRANSCFRIALQKSNKGLTYSYTDRKKSKKILRKLTIKNISSFLISSGIKYSMFVSFLRKANFKFSRQQVLNFLLNNYSILVLLFIKIRNQSYI